MHNEQERLAREWAERVKAAPSGMYSAEANAVAEIVLEHTTLSTMADVEWSDGKHYLAGATALDGQLEVMMWLDDTEHGHIITDQGAWRPEQLTPNGKRYELREVKKPEHPDTLTAFEDYENAPVGTVVAAPSDTCVIKFEYGWYAPRSSQKEDPIDFGRMVVLRWGWGE